MNVTKTYLPSLNEYIKQLEDIWIDGKITNIGPKTKLFEKKVKEQLSLNTDFKFISNGTLALQLAIRALNLRGNQIITTPFSYVASTNAILYEGFEPIFADINPDTLCIDETKIESLINKNTSAILAVHVLGNACNIEAINNIARKNNLKVIYDAAHSFGIEYNGNSIFDYGDVSITSFHATKVLHTIEGGGIFSEDESLISKIDLMRRSGHHGYEHMLLGTNAKPSEINAAMGLVNLNNWNYILSSREKAYGYYEDNISSIPVLRMKMNKKISKMNFSYYPIIFRTEHDLISAVGLFNDAEIFPRRYFYPSINEISYIDNNQKMPVSEDISRRILCIPIWSGIQRDEQDRVLEILKMI